MVYKQDEISRRTLSKKESDLVEQINDVLPIIENTIEEVKKGMLDGVNENQLLKIERELDEMIKFLNPKEYMPGFGHAIADSWDTEWALAKKLLNIIAKYKKL